METILEATKRLRADGYVSDFSATDDGLLLCHGCGATHDPEDLAIDEVVRYEGVSDPDDQEILFALECGCGQRGLYTSAFGPTTSIGDVAVLRRLG